MRPSAPALPRPPADPRTEDLIRARPLLFESRPIARIVKRLAPLTAAAPAPTPLPDLDLDFAHFCASLARIQLLLSTSTREVARYTADQGAITAQAGAARAELAQLRGSLAGAQTAKAHRLQYDAIAGDILGMQGLRPRAEQRVSLARLGGEIAELERERDEYSKVWAARRGQFEEIVKQLEVMSAQIKEDKDEQDRREGMSEEEEEGEEVGDKPLLAVLGTQGQGSTPVPVVEEREEGEEDEGERMDTS